MAFMTWADNLSVGVAEFDSQHKKLIDLINSLHDAMKTGKGKDVMGSVLDELVKYTQTHFTAEEKLMIKYNYSDLNTQKTEHANFVKKASDLRNDFSSGKVSISLEVMKFLQDWLSNHILKTDKNYGAFFNKNGVS